MLDFRYEQMGPHFHKHHIGGLPFPAVLHHFTEPDHGDPHDHNFPFRSCVLHGSYVEEVFDLTGSKGTRERKPGDSFVIEPGHIHRVIALPAGQCWTIMLPLGPTERTPGFYQWREDGAYHRFWHEAEFRRMEVSA